MVKQNFIRQFPELLLNEYQVKKSQTIRLNSDSFIYASVLKYGKISILNEIIYRLVFNVFSITNFFKLLLSSKKFIIPKKIFLYSNARNLRFCSDEECNLKVGLHRVDSEKHLYQVLSKRELINSVFFSLSSIWKVLKSTQSFCKAKEISVIDYCMSNMIGLVRILDFAILCSALDKIRNSQLAFAEHYDIYISTVNRFREIGKIKSLKGFQHGLMLSIGLNDFNKFHCDEYTLQFEESKKFFLNHMNGNLEVRLKIHHKEMSLIKIESSNPVVCLILQTDNFTQDLTLLDELIIRYGNLDNVDIYLYLHPELSKNYHSQIQEYEEKIFNIKSFEKKRHSNLNLVITKCSTLGVEYLSMGIPTIFFPFGVNFCALESINKKFIMKDIKEFREFISTHEI